MSPSATVTNDSTRRAYRRVLREARELGVPEPSIAVVVDAFVGEDVDPYELHAALMQYVPADRFHEDDAS